MLQDCDIQSVLVMSHIMSLFEDNDIQSVLVMSHVASLFQGSNMLTGCTSGDYTVWIGNETCSVIIVTDNRLECSPPKERPAQRAHGHIKHGAVQVIVSKFTFYRIFVFIVKQGISFQIGKP